MNMTKSSKDSNKGERNRQSDEININEKPSLIPLISLALQHMIIAVISAIPIPLLIGQNAGLSAESVNYLINASLVVTGISTIVASFNISPYLSPRLPMVSGASAATIIIATTTILQAKTPELGFRLIAGATICSGLLCFLIAPLWSKLKGLFPPLVVGTNMVVFGVSLLPNAFGWIVNNGDNGAAQPKAAILALVVCLTNVVLTKYLKGFLSNLSILFSIAVGVIVAHFAGMTDFSSVISADWVGLTLPFKYGAPIFDPSTIFSFALVMILGMVEVSGTFLGISTTVGMPIDENSITKVMRFTGVTTAISGGFHCVQTVPYSQNAGLMKLSKSYSRHITGLAGIFLVAISFFPKISAIIAAIPSPVLGGIGFATFGAIIASGVQILQNVCLKDNKNMLIIAISVGMALLPTVYPSFYQNFPPIVQTVLGNGMIAGSLTTVMLNLFFQGLNTKDTINNSD